MATDELLSVVGVNWDKSRRMAVVDKDDTWSYYSDSFEIDEEMNSSTNSVKDILSQMKSIMIDGELPKPSSKLPPKPPSSRKTKKEPTTTHKNAKRTLKDAAHDVPQASSVATRRFSDSVEVRDAVYSEWLAQKHTRISREKACKIRTEKEDEQRIQHKKADIAERSVKAVEKWNTSKEPFLREKHKRKLKQSEKERLKAEEQEQKQHDADITFKRWEEKKTEQLVSKHKEKKKKAAVEEKQKHGATKDKEQGALQAFRVWKDRKDATIKDKLETKHDQAKQIEHKKVEQKQERRKQSRTAFEAWKTQKDEKIKSEKTLYTYKHRTSIHTRGWCPARSMKYDYPRDKVPRKARPASTQGVPTSSWLSASTASFESDTSEISLLQDSNGTADSPKGTSVRKSIQVCCQTLEYWCTCNDDNDQQ